jgi:putative transposase
MPEYRRWRQSAGTYFFTVTLSDRRSRLLVERIAALRGAVAAVRRTRPFVIAAAVVLPDHLHMIWTLPAGDHDFSTRWRLIKSRFSARLPARPGLRPSLQDHGEKGIWQRRFFEHLIRDEADLAAHMDYIHYNPVKHGHAPRPVDWPHSSIHRFIQQGIVDPQWGTSGRIGDMDLD